MVVLLLFTHQAWSGIVCCGASQIEVQQSWHQTDEERCSGAGIGIETANRASTPCAEPGILSAGSLKGVFQCCQVSPSAEPQPLMGSASGQTLLATNFAVFATGRRVTAQFISHSPPPYRSGGIRLLSSCFLI
jgi:hypothetical protein